MSISGYCAGYVYLALLAWNETIYRDSILTKIKASSMRCSHTPNTKLARCYIANFDLADKLKFSHEIRPTIAIAIHGTVLSCTWPDPFRAAAY